MTTNLKVGDPFPDIELPNHHNEPARFSHFTKPGLFDEKVGFLDGYPLILVFYRGFYCSRDRQQMRREVFFNFTAIPGEGYRTINPGTAVHLELVESNFGLTARNIQAIK